jgi:bacterioferritin (cytochrome b1)
MEEDMHKETEALINEVREDNRHKGFLGNDLAERLIERILLLEGLLEKAQEGKTRTESAVRAMDNPVAHVGHRLSQMEQ